MSDTPDPDALVTDLCARFEAAARRVVPWFSAQMPEAYFQDTPADTRAAHLMALVAARASDPSPPRLTLQSDNGGEYTFLSEEDYPGLLAELLAQLPKGRRLTSAKVHTAADESLVLDVFRYDEDQAAFDRADAELAGILEATQAVAAAAGDADADLEGSFSAIGPRYLRSVPPARLYANHRLWAAVRGTADTVIERSPVPDARFTRISVATGNVDAQGLFERIVSLLGKRRVDIHRAFLDAFRDDGDRHVAVLGFIVTTRTCPDGEAWAELERDLARLRWLDKRAVRLYLSQDDLSLRDAEILIGLTDLAHARLAQEDAFAYARDRLEERAVLHLELTREVADLFARRFDPDVRLDDDALAAARDALLERATQRLDSEHDQHFLATLLSAVQCTLRTNLHLPRRYGLALRVSPAFFARDSRTLDPYGVFFVHGRAFDAFHVRFADIARGGVRVVRPRGREQHTLEADRAFEEAYDLAFAQRLKNKDIPEGGSKAVVLTEPTAPTDLSLQAFIDGLLDLLTPDPEVRAHVVDLFGAEELLYLGPDENVTPELIEWVVARARARGYPLPDAFMSSKPGAGINHKVYGVTSEGVTVFLEEALRSIGIDPRRQPFTVKLTGGPDGDVAGNEIKILAREFGANARVVAIADGSGSASDPDGLDMDALLALVEAEAPIADFDRTRLGPNGQVLGLDDPDGLRMRNTLCFTAVADAFVPAGGRPQTIHEGNWQRFLRADGTPTSRVVVEGANLFITPGARERLTKEAGVLIVKDSSANKCGVICSSYEITASMLLDEASFMAVKDTFVDQVLDRLRALARREAKLLFAEARGAPELSLPELSVVASRTILAAKDAIRDALPGLDAETRALLDELVVEHLPPALVAAVDGHVERLPERYREGIISASLATRLVYREGLAFLRDVAPERLAGLAIEYLRAEHEADRLAREVTASDLPDRDRIATLLRAGGARAAVER